MRLNTAFVFFVVSIACAAHADDGAASIAAGGVVQMGKEPRVTMAREVLQISWDKVIVDYDFRNDSDQDVVTEVAFPIPDYDAEMEDVEPARQGFDDFRLWIDGKPAKFAVETRAFVKGREITGILNRLHVDIGSFGHSTANDDSSDIRRLTAAQRTLLAKENAIDPAYNGALWTVRKKYHWEQVFPAHATAHVRHEYTPVVGNTNSVRYGMLGKDPDMVEELNSLCIDSQLRSSLTKLINTKGKNAWDSYVDFILTTANTWKTPIEDFTLIVERPKLKGSLASYVSFCWDGPIEKIDTDHFKATTRNFVPKKELRIGFISTEDRDMSF